MASANETRSTSTKPDPDSVAGRNSCAQTARSSSVSGGATLVVPPPPSVVVRRRLGLRRPACGIVLGARVDEGDRTAAVAARVVPGLLPLVFFLPRRPRSHRRVHHRRRHLEERQPPLPRDRRERGDEGGKVRVAAGLTADAPAEGDLDGVGVTRRRRRAPRLTAARQTRRRSEVGAPADVPTVESKTPEIASDWGADIGGTSTGERGAPAARAATRA